MSSTVTIPVDSVCERHDCKTLARYAYIVTGDTGVDGVAVYCSKHSVQMDESDVHTAIAEVDR